MEAKGIGMDCSPTVVSHTARLVQLEGVQDEHSKLLRELNVMLKEFTRIKYALYGALTLYLMQTLGISEVLKRMIL